MTTDPKLAVSDGRLSSLNTAAASKQNIPYESTGRCVGLVVLMLACMHAYDSHTSVVVEDLGMQVGLQPVALLNLFASM